MYKFVLDTVLPTNHVDMALISAQMQLPGMTPRLANYIINATGFGKPIVVFSIGGNEDARTFRAKLEGSGVPIYDRLEVAAKALRALYDYAVIRGVAAAEYS